jgi:hypothetical protein
VGRRGRRGGVSGSSLGALGRRARLGPIEGGLECSDLSPLTREDERRSAVPHGVSLAAFGSSWSSRKGENRRPPTSCFGSFARCSDSSLNLFRLEDTSTETKHYMEFREREQEIYMRAPDSDLCVVASSYLCDKLSEPAALRPVAGDVHIYLALEL